MRRFEFTVVGMGMNTSSYPGAFTRPVKEIIKSIIYGRVLHLYSGSSSVGDERVDLDHPNATINCKVEDFIRDDKRDWDWCILDPPYAIHRGNKLSDYGEANSLAHSLSSNVRWRNDIKQYFREHIFNILWLDYCAPMIVGFHRERLWLLLPGGYHTVRVLSWLKKEMQPLL